MTTSTERGPRREARQPTPFVALDPSRPEPLHRQLYDAIRSAIVSGRLPAHSRLPSTRMLADETGVSRVTVSVAFDQLRAEGYVETRTGSGTFVREGLPDDALHARRTSEGSRRERVPVVVPPGPSPTERIAMATPGRSAVEGTAAFRSGVPALDLFPVALWSKLVARRWRGLRGQKAEQLLGYGSPAGYPPLRQAIAEYVSLSRGVRTTASQVIVTAGAQQALDLAVRVLLEPGEPAWLEDPGYFGARQALESTGATIVPVPVDDEGLDAEAGERASPKARLVYVSPSHQYPLGVTMSMRRRLALLDWAARAGAWIVEDDYDGEFRYVGRPLASLQGLDADRAALGTSPDQQGRVLYVGTFSKTLFPSLRLGYLIVPERLVERFTLAKIAMDAHTTTFDQAVLAEFIEDGHYARHVRRMRLVYGERQRTLLAAASVHLSRWLDLQPASSGMHLVGFLREEVLGAGVSDTALAEAAKAMGVVVTPLSSYRLRPTAGPSHARAASPQGLIFGYAGCSDAMLWDGARRLEQAITGYLAERSPMKTRTRK